MNALAVIPTSNAEIYRASTDAAGLCREIVLKTAMAIQGRKYVKVEGWQAIAVAHGCVASAEDVHRINDEGMSGFSAMGVIRRMSDGAEIARAEGFLGDDEAMWTRRPVYARRAMAQTRAISRACRSAFAHVVVLIDANLSTTPAEEVPDGGFDDAPSPQSRRQEERAVPPGESAGVKAAKVGISLCKDKAALIKWKRASRETVESMSDAEIEAVVAACDRRLADIEGVEAPGTVDAVFTEAKRPELTLSEDEIPEFN